MIRTRPQKENWWLSVLGKRVEDGDLLVWQPDPGVEVDVSFVEAECM